MSLTRSYSVDNQYNLYNYRGDTITDACKVEDLKMKLDFWIGIFSPSSSFTFDTGTGEFAKAPTPSKYYSDRLKSFNTTKTTINSLAKKCIPFFFLFLACSY